MTLSEEREDNQLALPQSAGIGRRMIAFAMDFILLTFVAILILFYLPELLGKQTAEEFSRLSGKLIEAFEQPEPDQEHVQRVMMEFSEFSSKIHYEFVVTLVFVAYFFFGEFFFNGKSIGKSTLCIKSNNFRKNGVPLPPGQAVLRSLIKGLSCSFALLGFANFACLLFSKERRSLHDLLSGSNCILAIPNEKGEESKT